MSTELTLLGQEYFAGDIPLLLAQVSDSKLQGKGYSRLCGFQSHIFVQKEVLSLTRPVYTPHDYFDDYTLFRVRDLSKGRVVYFNFKAHTSSWAEIKNANHWFHPERDIAYINHCIVLPEPKLRIQGFSQDRNFVLLEVLDEGWPGTACQRGHEIVLPIENIDWSNPKEDICDDIYRYSTHRETCNIQPFSSVRLLDEIDEIFADADVEELNRMDRSLSGALQVYVGIDIGPLVYQAKRYTIREAKRVLAWLAWPGLTNSPDEDTLIAVNAIFEADMKNRRMTMAYLLKELLENAASFPRGYSTPDDLAKAFNQVIYEGKDTSGKTHPYTFLDLIQKSHNEGAWQWVHYFMKEGLCESADEDDGGLMEPCESGQDCPEDGNPCILQTYCVLSETMSDEAAQSLTDFEYFKKFIDDIVFNKINKSHWTRPNPRALMWHKDLCGNPTQ